MLNHPSELVLAAAVACRRWSSARCSCPLPVVRCVAILASLLLVALSALLRGRALIILFRGIRQVWNMGLTANGKLGHDDIKPEQKNIVEPKRIEVRDWGIPRH